MLEDKKLAERWGKVLSEMPKNEVMLKPAQIIESVMHMKASKDEMAQAIMFIYKDHLKPAMIKAGLGDVDIRITDKISADKVHEIGIWIADICQHEAEEFLKVFNLVPAEQWEHYKIFKLNDLIEVRMLKPVKAAFISKWKARPSSIRRLYKD